MKKGEDKTHNTRELDNESGMKQICLLNKYKCINIFINVRQIFSSLSLVGMQMGHHNLYVVYLNCFVYLDMELKNDYRDRYLWCQNFRMIIYHLATAAMSF